MKQYRSWNLGPWQFLARIVIGVSSISSLALAVEKDEEFCQSLKGEVVQYLLKTEDGQVSPVSMCWLGNGAIGTWTLYKFRHPWDFPHPDQPGPEATPQDQFLFSLANNPLTLKAVVTYFSNTRYSLEVEEEESLPDRKQAPIAFNQAFEFCKAAGGKPYRIERLSNYEARVNSKKDPKLIQSELIAKIKQGPRIEAPVEFKNQPFRSVCFWEKNSVIDVWSLFYGPEEDRNRELTAALRGR